MEPGQLLLVFADSPKGGKTREPAHVWTGEEFLLHKAGARKTNGPIAPASHAVSLEAVASTSNLAKALLHVARNRGAAGVDGKSVEQVVAEAHRLLPKLREELLTGSYRPGDVKRVWIPKPGGGQRGLGIPNVVDRWVQQAVHQALEPVFEPAFHASSHGFRPRRGAKTAVAEAKEHLKKGRTWVVAIDLSKFFDRVNHQRLLSRMAQRVTDGRILELVHRQLTAAVVLPNGTRVVTQEGTPQGGPLSPLLSNIVLDELDWEMERRGLCFVRYADDFNVYVKSERAGNRVMQSLTRHIERRLRLKVNVDKSVVAPSQQVHFLGFTLKPGKDGEIEVDLSERTITRFNTKIRELTPRNWGRTLDECLDNVSRYLDGWVAYFGPLCTEQGAYDFFRRFDAHTRRRIRAIIVKQRKRPRFLFRHLLKRGALEGAAAKTAFRTCGTWKKSNLPGMQQGYPNPWFHQRMTTLWLKWQRMHPPPTASGQAFLPGLETST